MANHDRDDLKTQGFFGKTIIVTCVIGAGKMIKEAGKMIKTAYNNAAEKDETAKESAERKSEYEGQLLSVQSDLSKYRSKFMARILYSDEISKLENKESELIKEIKKL